MKIAVIGAGAIGGYLGARLALAGEDVTFIVRGANLGARVVSIAGPWRRAGEWWQARDDTVSSPQLVMKTTGNFRRDYYELALADGCVYRVFCDLNSAQWFVDGIYD